MIEWLSDYFLQILVWVNGVVLNTHRNLKLVAGTGVTITPSEDVPNDANIVTISAAGGSGAPAGASNDIQINEAGAFAADTGQLCQDPTLHSFWAAGASTVTGSNSAALGTGHSVSGSDSTVIGGSSCTITGGFALVGGFICEALATASVAVGDESVAGGEGSFVSGILGNSGGLWGCRVHTTDADGAGLAEDRKEIGLYANGNAATVSLVLGDASELALDDAKVYQITVEIQAVKSGTHTSATEEHKLKAYATGGNLFIDSDVNILPPATALASQGWTVTILAPSGLTFRVSCDPGADDVNFFATVRWKALPGV